MAYNGGCTVLSRMKDETVPTLLFPSAELFLTLSPAIF